MTRLTRLAIVTVAALTGWPPLPAAAQHRFEVGVQLVSATSSEFDDTELGVGWRCSWHPSRLLGAEVELELHPGDFPGRLPFSRRRVVGLFGVTAGPTLGRLRPFVRVRPGFVSVHDAPQPFPCIQIFPPPLACLLAEGRTLLAFDVGGGVEVLTPLRTFLRLDAGDRLVRYTVPVLETDRTVRENALFGHDLRVAVGAGIRF